MIGRCKKLAVIGAAAMVLSATAVPAKTPETEVVAGLKVQGHGKFNNSASLLVDGAFVPQKSKFDEAGCVHWSDPDVYFVIDLGAVREIHDLKASVDNNDDYLVETSEDGSAYKPLLIIKREFGNVNWGMDTFSTRPGDSEFGSETIIPSRYARYVKVSASGGDKMYAMSELKIWVLPVEEVNPDDQETAGIPEPGEIKIIAKGSHENNVKLLIDGDWAEQGSDWNSKKCVHWQGFETKFLMDLGSIQKIKDIKISVDNNDVYQMDYSEDGETYKPLFTVKKADGEQAWGMDTMSTNSDSQEYVKEIDFEPVKARYLKLYAMKGDGMNAVSEVKVKVKEKETK